MNVTHIDPNPCLRIRESLDAYVSGEVSAEAAREVQRHAEQCETCAAGLRDRHRVKNMLRAAVYRESAPAALRDRVRREIARNAPGDGRANS